MAKLKGYGGSHNFTSQRKITVKKYISISPLEDWQISFIINEFLILFIQRAGTCTRIILDSKGRNPFEPELMYMLFKIIQSKFQFKVFYGSCLSLKIFSSFNL